MWGEQRTRPDGSASTVRVSVLVALHAEDLAVGQVIATAFGNSGLMVSLPAVRAIVVSSHIPQKELRTATGIGAVSARFTLAFTTTAGSCPSLSYGSLRKSHIRHVLSPTVIDKCHKVCYNNSAFARTEQSVGIVRSRHWCQPMAAFVLRVYFTTFS